MRRLSSLAAQDRGEAGVEGFFFQDVGFGRMKGAGGWNAALNGLPEADVVVEQVERGFGEHLGWGLAGMQRDEFELSPLVVIQKHIHGGKAIFRE